MKGTNLGEFEELVLLVVYYQDNQAYAVSIKEELEKQTGRSINVSAIHTALYRLEQKGYLRSDVGGATPERGGRWKRFFSITAHGKKVLAQSQELRVKLWNLIPELRIA